MQVAFPISTFGHAEYPLVWKMGALRAKLTKMVVQNAEPAAKRFAIHDTMLPGFKVFVYPSGAKIFYFRHRVGGGRLGKIREPKLGTFGEITVDQARAISLGMAHEVRQGGDPSATKKQRLTAPTMSDLFEIYYREHALQRKKPSSQRHDLRMIEVHLKPFFKSSKVAEVKRADILRLQNSLSATPYEANRVLSLLSKMFNLAES